DFRSCFLKGSRTEMKWDSEAMEPLLELQAVQPQELSRLPQGDLSGKIGAKSAGIRIFRRLNSLLVVDRALRQGLKDTEIQEVHENEGLVTGPFDNRGFPGLHAVSDLLDTIGQVGLGDRGPSHGNSLHP